MIKLNKIMLTANGQTWMPLNSPTSAGSKFKSSVVIAGSSNKNIREINPNAVVIRAIKHPQNRNMLGRSESLVGLSSLFITGPYSWKVNIRRCEYS